MDHFRRISLRQCFCYSWLLCMFVSVPSIAAAQSHTTAATVTTAPLPSLPPDRKLHVINQSGERVSVEWLNPLSGESIPLGAPTTGQQVVFHTYVNHTFVVMREGAPQGSNTDDQDDTPATATIKISEDQLDQVFVIREGLAIEMYDVKAEQDEDEATRQAQVEAITRKCQEKARQALEVLDDSASFRRRQRIVENLKDCLTEETATLLENLNEDLAEEQHLRLEMSRSAENYTCTDPTRETSKPIAIRQWMNVDPAETPRTVHILHDRPSSQIHLVQNFITPEECKAVQDEAAKTLHRGTVADGKGGSRLSESRKAWQAGIRPKWDLGPSKDPIAAVAQRILDYTNHVTGYNLTHHGQEDLMSIQYFGSGDVNDPTPDRYMPHCDGDCNGMPHKTGGRVATMVLYCDAPTLGGGTNFQSANVFVKPTVGAAAFFSYLDPKTMKMETGFTTHSGCPVYEGTKRIAVQWMRVGVDNENPWDSFDTNTIKRSRRQEQEDEEESCEA